MRKMKNSGVDWIGQIPSDWDTKKCKYITTFINGFPFESERLKSEYLYPVIRISDIQDGSISLDDCLGIDSNYGLASYLIKNGDILLAMSGATVGKVGIVKGDVSAYINQRVGIIRTGCPSFLFYCLSTKNFVEYVMLMSAGTAQPNISTKGFGEYPVPFPPIDEQQKIADFLDEKCGEIDSIRSDIQKQIDILNDYKKSVISETVTKGLNPKAKLKDSGIEWIGKIPEGWKTSYIKRLFDITLGKMINSEKDAGLENYLCAANIKWTGINVGVHKQMHFSEYEKKLYLLNDGDILVMEGGMAGTAAIYHNEFYPCYIQNSVMRCRSKNATNLQTFLYYWLFAIYHLGYIDRICNRATIQHYTKEKLGNTPILFPPLPEQKAIADYLDEKCSEIDATIADKQKQLETLDEYKKSLIFEYVTGKKEVS